MTVDKDDGLTARIGGVVFKCEPRGTHYHVTVRGHGPEGHRPLLGTLTCLPDEWHNIVDAGRPMEPDSQPLETAVEVDWQRPLDDWEKSVKDELFLWGPFFRGLGHAHLRLDANARYALARIVGVLHRRASAQLMPAENMALRVARGQVERGDNPGINTTTMLVMALDRLSGHADWIEEAAVTQ